MREIFINPPLSAENCKLCIFWINTLKLVTDYANRRQLSKIVNTIMHDHDNKGAKYNIWSVFFDCGHHVENMLCKVGKFFESVANKLGEDALKDLILHNDAKTITQALWCYEDLNEVVLAHFSDEKKSEVGKCIVENASKNVPQIIVGLDEEDFLSS